MKIPVDITVKKRCLLETTRLKACDVAEGEEFSYSSVGTMTIRGRTIKLNYTENDGVEIEETLNGDKRRTVAVTLFGGSTFALVYEPGISYICFFPHEERKGFVRITTKALDVELSELGGKLHVDYISEIMGAGAERVDLTLTVAPQGEFLKS